MRQFVPTAVFIAMLQGRTESWPVPSYVTNIKPSTPNDRFKKNTLQNTLTFKMDSECISKKKKNRLSKMYSHLHNLNIACSNVLIQLMATFVYMYKERAVSLSFL